MPTTAEAEIRAIIADQLAARVPDAAFTDVEVRPVLDLRGMEM